MLCAFSALIPTALRIRLRSRTLALASAPLWTCLKEKSLLKRFFSCQAWGLCGFMATVVNLTGPRRSACARPWLATKGHLATAEVFRTAPRAALSEVGVLPRPFSNRSDAKPGGVNMSGNSRYRSHLGKTWKIRLTDLNIKLQNFVPSMKNTNFRSGTHGFRLGCDCREPAGANAN